MTTLNDELWNQDDCFAEVTESYYLETSEELFFAVKGMAAGTLERVQNSQGDVWHRVLLGNFPEDTMLVRR